MYGEIYRRNRQKRYGVYFTETTFERHFYPEGAVSFPEQIYQNVAETTGFLAYIVLRQSPAYLRHAPTLSTRKSRYFERMFANFYGRISKRGNLPPEIVVPSDSPDILLSCDRNTPTIPGPWKASFDFFYQHFPVFLSWLLAPIKGSSACD